METGTLTELDAQKRGKTIPQNAFENEIARPLSEEMDALKRIGRIIGVLLLVQFLGSVLVDLVLMVKVTNPPGYLVNAAANSLLFSLSVFIELVTTGAPTVGIAILAFPVFRQYSQTMALWFLTLAVVTCSLIAVESANMLSMLSLSQAYAKADAADAALFQTLGGVLASARNWAHYIDLITGGSTMLVLYSVLYRSVLIPRALAAFGLATVMLQLITVTTPLFGYRFVLPMLIPVIISHLALTAWLLAKGFEERQQSASIGRE